MNNSAKNSLTIFFLFLIISAACSPKIEKISRKNNANNTQGPIDQKAKKLAVSVVNTFFGGEIHINGSICTSACVREFDAGTQIFISASALTGYIFKDLTSASCSGAVNCSFILTKDEELFPYFLKSPVPTYELNFNRSGTMGEIYINGDLCQSPCHRNYPKGSILKLSASPDKDTSFDGFAGACTGTSPVCTLIINSPKNVTASFSSVEAPVYYHLSLITNGLGTIAVNGISCGTSCSGKYIAGAQLILTGTPLETYSFNGFSGDCSGHSSCTITMNSNKTVISSFSEILTPIKYYNLSFSSNLPGGLFINGNLCLTNCSGSYAEGTSLTLNAIAPDGYFFSSFSGNCTGNQICTLLIDGDKSVIATFQPGAPETIIKKFGWDASPGAVGYKIYFGDSPGSYNGNCIENQISPIDIPINALADNLNPNISLSFKKDGSNCYFVISAYNQVGESNVSGEIILALN